MYFWQVSKMRRRAEWLASQTFVVLAIQVPKDNEKTPQSAEQFFAALHGIFRNDPIIQEHIGFEIVGEKDLITFYVFTPIHLKEFIEGQLYAQYPSLQINQVNDYTRNVDLQGLHIAASTIKLTREDVYPIKTFTATEVDPLAGITAVMAGLEERQQIWFQMVIKPVSDKWQNRGVKYVQDLRNGKHSHHGETALASFGHLALRVVREIMQEGAGTNDHGKAGEGHKLSAPEEAALKGIESKITKLGFETIFRLVAIAPDEASARARTQAMLAALKQYNTTNLNGFIGGEVKIDDYAAWQQYSTRQFEENGKVLNIEELASIYHLPTKSVETGSIAWAGSKKGEAPSNLPLKDIIEAKELTVIGKTDFRNTSKEFGIKLDDRKRHMYIIGKSGTGKSTLLENMIIDDINEGRGIILVDPHGELADKIVESIPEHRIKDAIVLDPADRQFPLAFNLLEKVSDDHKGTVASGFVGIFKKIFGNSWGPRLEYILRNTVLALLETEGATMLGIPRMLTEQAYREQVIAQIKDVVVRDFWVNEWGSMDQKQRVEAMGPILNKVGQFLSNSTIRNIVGQPKSTFDVREVMDQEKILIINLSKGKIGEDNMALLGAMIITKVQLAAMSRADVAATERPNCFLYVDEFQNFATESFANILSEARKYGLGLTIAHQYIAQVPEEVRDAVIGNVGTLITFRVGAPDAESLAKEFEPVFNVGDMVNLRMAHIYIKLLIDGITSPAFSAQTLPPKKIDYNFRDQVVAFSREHYSRTREDVEVSIEEHAGYKQKREAEEANKLAANLLKQGNQAIGIGANRGPDRSTIQDKPLQTPPSQKIEPVQQVQKPAPVPVTPPVVAPTLVPEVQVSKPVEKEPEIAPVAVIEDMQTPIEEGIKKEKTPGKEKPLKIMNGWVYKEVAQKGGMKWYIGEKEAEVQARKEAKEREKAEAKKEISDSPAEPSPSEHTTNGDIVDDAPINAPEPVVVPAEKREEKSVSLEEGQSISL
jgi:hypothetical protein